VPRHLTENIMKVEVMLRKGIAKLLTGMELCGLDQNLPFEE